MKDMDRAVRDWVDQSGPPPEIEQAVLAEFDRVGRVRVRRQWALAAVVVAASALIAWTAGRRPPAPEVQMAAQSAEPPFTALPYVIQPAAYERTEVIRMTVPVSELIAAGFAMETDLGLEVEADVLLGQDRRARAVRLVTSFE
jgi:hypothetical protein